jgi:hypothetical protein
VKQEEKHRENKKEENRDNSSLTRTEIERKNERDREHRRKPGTPGRGEKKVKTQKEKGADKRKTGGKRASNSLLSDRFLPLPKWAFVNGLQHGGRAR